MATPPLRIQVTADTRQAEAALDRTSAKVASVGARAKTAASGFGSLMSNMGGQGRFIINNTANQLGDMAVQLSMGTSAMRVMGFQLPQLLGGFSALGGALGVAMPLLGAVAAIGFPIAAAFMAMGRNAEEGSSGVNDLADALGEYDRVSKIASMSTVDLREEFGELQGAAREAYLALEELRRVEAFSALQSSIIQINSDLLELGDTPQRLKAGMAALNHAMQTGASDDMLDRIRGKISEIEGELGMTADQFVILNGALTELGQIDTLDEMQETTVKWRSLLLDAFGTVEDMPEQFRAVWAAINQANIKTIEFATNVEKVAKVLPQLRRASRLSAMEGELDPSVTNWAMPSPSDDPKSGGSIGRAASAALPKLAEMTDEMKRLEQASNSVASAISQGFREGTTLADKLGSAIGRVMERMLDMFLQQQIVGSYGFNQQTGQWGGTGLMAAFGPLLEGLFSFDGGGFTGAGSRSGGVDGRGGFPAILHPNETVIDHTRGTGGGGGIVINQNISVNQGGQNIPPAKLFREIRVAATDAVADAMQRGGGFRGVMSS